MIYIDIRNTRSITAQCAYGSSKYCNLTMFYDHHDVDANRMYYICNALPNQQFEPIYEYCMGNKHRKYMNAQKEVSE